MLAFLPSIFSLHHPYDVGFRCGCCRKGETIMLKFCYRVGCLLLTMTLLPYHGSILLYAQDDCDTFIEQHLKPALARCSELNTDWACYGDQQISASPPERRFRRPKDREMLSYLTTIDTLNETGAAVMRLHLRPDQDPVTVLLYGNARLTPAGANVFSLQIEDTGFICASTPPGMIARTASGQRGRITVNGADIALESVVFITVQRDGVMVIANIEGQVTVTVGGIQQSLPPGQQVQIAQVNGSPVFVGLPAPSPYIDSAVIQWLASDGEGLRRVTDPNTDHNPVIPPCGGPLAFGETISAQNFTSGQECLYTFCVNEGEPVTINLEAVDGMLDPWIDLRGPDGAVLKFSNDISEDNVDSLICNRVLPASGCYTIVARPDRNNSIGKFNLTLNRQTACTPPVPRCEVAADIALNLRTGPGTSFPPVQVLPPETRLQPQASSADNRWVRVQVVGTTQEGWVSANPQFLTCEEPIGTLTPTWTPALTPTPTATSTPTPTATREPEVERNTPTPPCPKCSPFSAP
jgi:hypothetical protein